MAIPAPIPALIFESFGEACKEARGLAVDGLVAVVAIDGRVGDDGACGFRDSEVKTFATAPSPMSGADSGVKSVRSVSRHATGIW